MEVLCWYIVEADWLVLLACVLMIIAATLLAFREDPNTDYGASLTRSS